MERMARGNVYIISSEREGRMEREEAGTDRVVCMEGRENIGT